MSDTPLPLDEAAAKIQRAREEVFGLCDGKRKWTMRVPVDRERDSDCVICDALDVADALRARVAELEAELAITQKYADDCGSLLTRATTERDAAYSHAAKLREALVKCEDEWRKLGGPLSAWPKGDGRRDTARELADECAAALDATPAADLSAHDAEVLTLAFNELSRLGAFVPGGMDMARALAAHEVKP